MEHIKILDELLKYLTETEYNKWIGIRNDTLKKSDFLKDIGNSTLHSALLKLVKDEYVNQDSENTTNQIFNTPRTNHYYKISFEGLVFIKNGGYQNQNDEIQRKQNELSDLKSQQSAHSISLVRLNRWLVILTWVIAIGTFVAGIYYLIEILKAFGICV